MTRIPCELAAVIQIFSHDDELRIRALPHVNIERREINWDAIFDRYYGSGHSAAIHWAYGLWRDALTEDLLAESFSMDSGLKRAVLRALAVRWGLPIDNVNPFHVA